MPPRSLMMDYHLSLTASPICASATWGWWMASASGLFRAVSGGLAENIVP